MSRIICNIVRRSVLVSEVVAKTGRSIRGSFELLCFGVCGRCRVLRVVMAGLRAEISTRLF